jgi:hypothetical protein
VTKTEVFDCRRLSGDRHRGPEGAARGLQQIFKVQVASKECYPSVRDKCRVARADEACGGRRKAALFCDWLQRSSALRIAIFFSLTGCSQCIYLIEYLNLPKRPGRDIPG